jgi:4-hydroxybenzoate polyprenyltransferase
MKILENGATAKPWEGAFKWIGQLLITLRPRHWIKNGFLFAPLFFSGHFYNVADVALVIRGFVLFSLTASAIYIFNDLMDRERDALSELSKHRPIAAGTVPLPAVIVTALIFIVVALVASYHTGYEFCLLLSLYIANNAVYTLLIKNRVVADVISIAAGFVIRILAGASLIGVEASPWLIVCTFSLALLLGFGKRRAELFHASGVKIVSTIYTAEKLDHMISVSTAIALLSYMLYVVSPESVERFKGHLMLFTVPFVVYGIFRFVAKIQEGKCKDPVHLIYSDRVSVLNILFWFSIVMAILLRGDRL